MQRSEGGTVPGRLGHEDVALVVGEIDPARAAAIIASGATLEELIEAAAWAAGEREIMGEETRPATGPISIVYDILTSEAEPEEGA